MHFFFCNNYYALNAFEFCLFPSDYGINSILFQRGIYPAENFKNHQQYGLTILMSTDEKIQKFLENVLKQTQGKTEQIYFAFASLPCLHHFYFRFHHAEWLARNELDKVSLIITNAHTKEVLECWDFNVQSESKVNGENVDPNNPKSCKELKRIQQEIGNVMRQIAGTVTYLPLIDCICSFDVLIHTVKDCELPEKWNEADPVHIQNSQTVKLRSFSTGLHQVETVVNYKLSS